MKTFQDFKEKTISESITDIVYHMTTTGNIADIIASNKFALTVALGTSSDLKVQPKGKWYYLSTARTTDNKYFQQRSGGGKGYLVLDGRKLSQRYASKPVDYWEGGPKYSETEDRIVSKDPFISNAISYIKEIHLFLPEQLIKGEPDPSPFVEAEKRRVAKLSLLAKKNNIPIYYYGDEKSFLSKNKNKAIPLPVQNLKSIPNIEKPYRRYDRRLSDKYTRWLELAYKNKLSELGKYAKDTAYRLGWYRDDYATGLKADIHNYKTKGESEPVLNAIRYMKAKSVEDFIDALYKKWEPKLSESTTMKSFWQHLREAEDPRYKKLFDLLKLFLEAIGAKDSTLEMNEITWKDNIATIQALMIKGAINFIVDLDRNLVTSIEKKPNGKQKVVKWSKGKGFFINEADVPKGTTYNVYITSGKFNAQYTLRYSFKEKIWTHSGSYDRERDHHLRNLGRDKKQAIQKAEEYVDKLRKNNPNNKYILDKEPHTSILSDYLKGEAVLRFGKYARSSIDVVAAEDPNYLFWAYKTNPALFNTYQKDFLKKNFPEEIKKAEELFKKEKEDEERRKKEHEIQREREKESMARMMKLRPGDDVEYEGEVVSIKGSHRFNSTNYIIKPHDETYLVWFSTTKKEFDNVHRNDIIKIGGYISGKGDNIIFVKKPHIIP